MSYFLAVQKREVVDVPGDPGDPTATPPVPPTPAQTHEEIKNAWVESSAEQIAINLADDADGDGPGIDYYHLQFNGAGLVATLHPVTLKAGPRQPAPTREVVEIEADGSDVGSGVRAV